MADLPKWFQNALQSVAGAGNAVVPEAHAAMAQVQPTSNDWFGNPQTKVYFRPDNSLSSDPATGADFSHTYYSGPGTNAQIMNDLNNNYPGQTNNIGSGFGGMVQGPGGAQDFQSQFQAFTNWLKSHSP